MHSRAPTAPPRTGSSHPWLDLCWRVVRHGLTALYLDASRLVAVHGVDPVTLASPLERYRLHAVRALLLEHAGRAEEAQLEAREALAVKGLERAPAAPAASRARGAPDPDAEVDARLVVLAG